MNIALRHSVERSCGGECFRIGVVVGVHAGALASGTEAMRDVFDHRETDGDKEDAEEGGEHHATDDDSAEDLP